MSEYFVITLNQEEVAEGKLMYLTRVWSDTLSKDYQRILEQRPKGIRFSEKNMIVYSISGLDQPQNLISRFGEHYMYFFANDIAKDTLVENGVNVNIAGEIEEDKIPDNITLLIRSSRFLPQPI